MNLCCGKLKGFTRQSLFPKNLGGFTVIELLLVIAIIGLIASIIVVALSGAKAQARDAKREAEVDAIRKAVEFYYIEHNQYPKKTEWAKLEEDPNLDTGEKFSEVIKEWLPTIPKDPLYGKTKETGEPYSYQYKTNDDATEYKIHVEMESGTYASYESYSSGGGEIVYGGGPTLEISTCSTLDQANTTYYLTADITNSGASECIKITADNVTLNCQKHTIDGVDATNTQGVFSENTSRIKIKECRFTDWDIGVYYGNVSSSSVEEVTSTSNVYAGALIGGSSNVTLSNITANSNHIGIDVPTSTECTLSNITTNSNGHSGIVLRMNSSNITFSNITANSNSQVGVWLNEYSSSNNLSNITTNSNGAGGVWLDGASNNTLSNITADANGTPGEMGFGITLDAFCGEPDKPPGEIDTPIAFDGPPGPCLGSNNNQVNGVTVTHHTSKDTSTGLFIGLNSKGNTFSNITANLNENGIYLYFTSPISETSTHTFTNTTVSSNAWGIIIQEGASSYKAAIIEHSHIENNSDYGIYITSDCPSQIYNNILSNTTNTNSMTNSNEWNVSKQLGDNIYDSNNPYIGGNYWTNPSATGYSDTCVDSDTNGFCDAFYSINADNIDNLPLSDEYVAS